MNFILLVFNAPQMTIERNIRCAICNFQHYKITTQERFMTNFKHLHATLAKTQLENKRGNNEKNFQVSK